MKWKLGKVVVFSYLIYILQQSHHNAVHHHHHCIVFRILCFMVVVRPSVRLVLGVYSLLQTCDIVIEILIEMTVEAETGWAGQVDQGWWRGHKLQRKKKSKGVQSKIYINGLMPRAMLGGRPLGIGPPRTLANAAPARSFLSSTSSYSCCAFRNLARLRAAISSASSICRL